MAVSVKEAAVFLGGWGLCIRRLRTHWKGENGPGVVPAPDDDLLHQVVEQEPLLVRFQAVEALAEVPQEARDGFGLRVLGREALQLGIDHGQPRLEYPIQ